MLKFPSTTAYQRLGAAAHARLGALNRVAIGAQRRGLRPQCVCGRRGRALKRRRYRLDGGEVCAPLLRVEFVRVHTRTRDSDTGFRTATATGTATAIRTAIGMGGIRVRGRASRKRRQRDKAQRIGLCQSRVFGQPRGRVDRRVNGTRTRICSVYAQQKRETREHA